MQAFCCGFPRWSAGVLDGTLCFSAYSSGLPLMYSGPLSIAWQGYAQHDPEKGPEWFLVFHAIQ